MCNGEQQITNRLIALCLAKVWGMFLKLSNVSDVDRHEFMHAIHAAQNIVLARDAIETKPFCYSQAESDGAYSALGLVEEITP